MTLEHETLAPPRRNDNRENRKLARQETEGRRIEAMKGPQEKSRCVVVYDEDCPFCRKQMAWVRAKVSQEPFEFVASQAPGLTERFPVLRGEDLGTGLRLLLPDGSVLSSADAVHGIARRLPRWRWIAWLYRVPGLHALARKLYAWVAAHRHALAHSSDETPASGLARHRTD